ncbi:MAG: thiamine diphosphokinase [Clostridiales bacterium]|nr:thiamine diphosphokinase [Clostridiales bacterium]
MGTCLIISGGDYSPLKDDIGYDYVIACDLGYEHALKMGIKPDIMVSDFDSLDRSKFPADEIALLEFPVRKDDSDTMLAIKHALKEGYGHIVISCALGGRLDHTIANIQSMAYVAERGGVCEIISDKEYLRTFTGGELSLEKREGFSLSLFSITDRCTGVSISGSAYDCENVTLTNSFPLGISNCWKEERVTIRMSEGIMLIAESLIK